MGKKLPSLAAVALVSLLHLGEGDAEVISVVYFGVHLVYAFQVHLLLLEYLVF